jgi:uncharacterized membrane protein
MENKSTQPTSDDKLFGAIAYVWIAAVIIYMLKKDNPFVLHHARQGLVLFLGSLVWFIPGVGWVIATVAVIGMVIGFLKAQAGEKYEMPFVHLLAEKIKF